MYNSKRRVVTYLNPKYTALFIAHAYDNGEDKSPAAFKIMKRFYDDLPIEEQLRLLFIWIEMDDQNKKAEFGNESTLIKKIFRHFLNSLPEEKQKRLQRMFDKMTDEEIKRPGKR